MHEMNDKRQLLQIIKTLVWPCYEKQLPVAG